VAGLDGAQLADDLVDRQVTADDGERLRFRRRRQDSFPGGAGEEEVACFA
jgi:hypothetical protein